MPTRYIAAYDTERKNECLNACYRIQKIHEKYNFPATFFVVAELLVENGHEFKKVLGQGRPFEIASHSYSHRLLKDHPLIDDHCDKDEKIKQIRLSKQYIEDVFERPCVGLRTPVGYANALRGEKWLLNELVDAGYQYVSSLLWGPETTMPALLEKPFTYFEDGMSNLWEFPGHGWHENLLKSHNFTTQPQRIRAWPMPFPEIIPHSTIKSPDEEFRINRIIIDRAIEMEMPYVSFVWHPWSLALFDPEMSMLEQTFQYVKDRGLEPVTFEQELKILST